MSRNPVKFPEWAAVNRDEMGRMGEDPLNKNRELRITWLALARLEPQRHAHFKTGELSKLLEVVGRKTGNLQRPHRNTVKAWIDNLVEIGFLRSDSNARCLIVNLDVAHYAVAGPGRNRDCSNGRRATVKAA